MTLPATTRALALREGGFASAAIPAQPESLTPYLELNQVPLPPLGPGQVLIRVIMAPVNPSDLFFLQGGYGQPRVAGRAAGFEGVGEVIAGQGPAAEALTGRRVAFLGTVTGSWAEHAISDAALCIPLRPDLRDEDGAALIVNPLTAVALIDRVRESGSKAFLLNAANSQLGRLVIGLARDEGLHALAVVRRPEAAEGLADLGAAEVLVSDRPGFDAVAAAAIRSHKPRVLLDAVADQVTADLFFAMPAGARWIIYGRMSAEPPVLSQMGQFIFMDKHIEGFWLSRWLPAAAPERRGAVVSQVQLRFADRRWSTRVAARLPLDAAIGGVLPALAEGAGKVMIVP